MTDKLKPGTPVSVHETTTPSSTRHIGSRRAFLHSAVVAVVAAAAPGLLTGPARVQLPGPVEPVSRADAKLTYHYAVQSLGRFRK